MTFYEFIKEFKKLNPKVDFSLINPNFSTSSTLYLDEKIENLKLPEGFEYNKKNGITNKHNSKNGDYINIEVKPRSLNHFPMTEQEQYNAIVKNTEQMDEKEEWDYYSFLYEFKRLNPGLKLDAQHPKYSSTATETIYFTPTPQTDMQKEVNIPEGFSYDKETKTFTNKHLTKSGNYINIKIQNTSKLEQNISSTFMDKVQLDKRYAKSKKLQPIFSKLIPNVSQTTDKFALLYALQKLNPDANLTFMHPAFSNSQSLYFAENFDISSLKLPDGFEYNKKNGITNKNLTETGDYIAIKLEQQRLEDIKLYYTQKQLKTEFEYSPELQSVMVEDNTNSL